MKRRIAIAVTAMALGGAGLAACGDEGSTTTVTEQATAPATTTQSSTTSTTSSSTTSTEDETTTESTTTTSEDVSGNCDEPEHADDAKCSGGVPAPSEDDNGNSGGYYSG